MKNARRLAIMILLGPLVVYGATPDPIGSIVAIKGYAHAVAKDATPRVLKVKAPVYLNEKVVTGAGARIQIMFKDTTLISQGEKSELVLNSFVYSPEKKKPSGATFGMKKGLFRVLTGKITDVNPDRFKVKTRMATIGIRGCHLGFDVDEAGEDVYVLWMPRGKSVLVETDAKPASGRGGQRDNVMQILESGIAIAVDPGSALESRDVDPTEARQLFLDTSVLGGDVSGAESDPAEEADEFSDVSELLNGFTEEAEESLRGQDSSTADNPVEGIDERLVLRRPESRPALSEEVPVDMVVPTFPGEEQITGPTAPPPSEPVVVPTLPPELVAQGGGWWSPMLPPEDWVWTVHREYLDGDVSGTPTGPYAVDYGAYGAPNGVGEFMPTDAMTTILAETTTRYLTGMGSAAAAIDAAGVFKEMQGTCDLTVGIGGGVSQWTGIYDLTNTDGDILKFDIVGSISGSGALTGTRGTTYDLALGTDIYDATTITAESVEGGLIGPGDGSTGGVDPTAISSLAGGFIFVHGTAVRIDGVFGGPLN